MRIAIASLIFAGLLSSCATVPAVRVSSIHMYNLTSGELVAGTAQTNRAGQSVISAGPTKSGETFSGEATSVDNRIRSSSYGGGRISNPGILTDSYISTSSYSTTTPGYQNGSAILVGSQGTVIDVLYRVSVSGTGEGEGKDNKGASYRIQVSPQY